MFLRALDQSSRLRAESGLATGVLVDLQLVPGTAAMIGKGVDAVEHTGDGPLRAPTPSAALRLADQAVSARAAVRLTRRRGGPAL
jgi:hypothetical protein